LGFDAGDDETGLAKDVEVLGNRGGAQVECFDEFARGAGAIGEQFDDTTPGRVGDGDSQRNASRWCLAGSRRSLWKESAVGTICARYC